MNLNVIKAPETNLQEGEAGRGWRKGMEEVIMPDVSLQISEVCT